MRSAHPTSMHELRVARVVRETDACSTFVLEVPQALEGSFRYRAGQYLIFELVWQDFVIRRCYSLSSSPEVDRALAVTVKRIADGRASNWMNDQLEVGDTVRVSEPRGDFVLDAQTASTTPLLFFAGGSGITPVLSLLKTALATTSRKTRLVYASSDRESMIFATELQELAKVYGARLDLQLHLDDPSGFLTEAALRDFCRGFETGEAYLCGPAPFMNLVEEALTGAGLPEARVHVERFVSLVDPDRVDEHAVEVASLPAPASFSLWLDGRSRTIPYQAGESLLEAARRAGHGPPSSCESGFCGTCMAGCLSGEVYMPKHEALSQADIADGRVLLCQAVPSSTASLELSCDVASFRAGSLAMYGFGKTASRWAAAMVFALATAGTLVLRLLPHGGMP